MKHVSRTWLWLLLACSASLAAAPDFTGVWRLQGNAAQLQAVDGKPLPLTAWGKQQYATHQKLRARGDVSFDLTMNRCASPGAVRMMTLPYAIEFFQRPEQLAMLFEWNHLYRLINLRSTPRVAPYPLAIGISNGHWDNDTLVIESTDFTDNTLLDSSGLPHSDQLTVSERIRLLDAAQLEVTMTLSDAKAFTRPWTTTLTYRKVDAHGINEDVCLDRLEAGGKAIADHAD